jgi:hypothetical protein
MNLIPLSRRGIYKQLIPVRGNGWLSADDDFASLNAQQKVVSTPVLQEIQPFYLDAYLYNFL